MNQDHIKALSFVVKRGKEIKGMERTEAAEDAAWLQRRDVARKEHERERERRRRGNRDGGERIIRRQIVQDVVAGIQEKVSVHDGIKEAVQRPAWHSFMRKLEGGIAHKLKMKKKKIVGEKRTRWQHSGMNSNNWRRSWRRRIGRTLFEAGGRAKGTGAGGAGTHVTRQRVEGSQREESTGWSIEETKEKPNTAVAEDTEEMRKWRGLSHSEMDQCWKNLAERIEEEVPDKYKVEEGKREFRGRVTPLEWRRVRKNKKYRIRKWREDSWARIFSLFRKQLAASAKQAGGANGRRRDEAAAKNGDYERSDKENQVKRKNGR